MKLTGKSLKKYIIHFVFLISLFAIFSGCKKDAAKPGTNEVWMQNTAFTPSTITVASHTTITWTNKDGMNHTVTSNSGMFDSGNLGDGGTFSFKFDSAGTYSYHCKIHSGMSGQVIVN